MPTPTANNTAKAIASRSRCAMPTMGCRTAAAIAAQRMSLDHCMAAATPNVSNARPALKRRSRGPTGPPASGGGKDWRRRAGGGIKGSEGRSSVVFTAVARGKLGERVGRNLVGTGDRDASRGEGTQRCGPLTAFEQCALSEDGARSDLGERLCIDLH